MWPLMGTNKAAWGVKLLLTTVSPYQQFLCPIEDIALLFASLWMVLPVFSFTPAYPLYTYFIPDIARVASQKPAVLAV